MTSKGLSAASLDTELRSLSPETLKAVAAEMLRVKL
jgi:hypothetical protein